MRKIARIVVNGWPYTNPVNAEDDLYRCLLSITEEIQFLTTPGGFIFIPFPIKWEGPSGWLTKAEDSEILTQLAALYVKQVISPRIIEAARNKVKYLTLSLDLRSSNTPLHAELVALIDLSSGKILSWTGKSYPTMDQEKSLIHITDLKSHLIEVGGEKLLILGCHDLNIYNNRARTNQKVGGLRHQRCQAMLKLFDAFQPTIILQHPHATDTWKSWIQGWREVARRYPQAAWASAIAYASLSKTREPLNDVLAKTHYEGDLAFNIIMPGRANPVGIQRMVMPRLANSKAFIV